MGSSTQGTLIAEQLTETYGLYSWNDFVMDSADAQIAALQGWAGFSDSITFGGSEWARNQMGTNYADPCSTAYSAGEVASWLVGGKLIISGIVKASKYTTKANTAFDIAKAGGRNSGLLKNYTGRSTAEINKGITSLERQAALHREKLANPSKFAERWNQMSPQEQAGLVKYWQKEAASYQEQASALRGLLGGQ